MSLLGGRNLSRAEVAAQRVKQDANVRRIMGVHTEHHFACGTAWAAGAGTAASSAGATARTAIAIATGPTWCCFLFRLVLRYLRVLYACRSHRVLPCQTGAGRRRSRRTGHSWCRSCGRHTRRALAIPGKAPSRSRAACGAAASAPLLGGGPTVQRKGT